MSGREELNEMKDMAEEIRSNLKVLEEVKSQAYKVNSILNGLPFGKKVSDKVGEGAIKLVELEEELKEAAERYNEMSAKVIRKINKMKKVREKNILKLRYIVGRSFESIARIMQVSKSWIFQLHREALMSYEKIYKQSVVKSS